MKIMFHVLPTRTSLKGGGHGIFVSPRAYIGGGVEIFSKSEGLYKGRKLVADVVALQAGQPTLRGRCGFGDTGTRRRLVHNGT